MAMPEQRDARSATVPKWIWLPELRNLPATFAFFRREVTITDGLREAAGVITADSRYELYINGNRVQKGPAPFDPRYHEYDPFDITEELQPGVNTIGVLVCFFGHGDGTYIPGNPGLWFDLALDYADHSDTVVSGSSWRVQRAQCWRAGHYKRWFLRALQEEFDARLYPEGWNRNGYDDGDWAPAMELDVPDGKPVVCMNRSNSISDFRVRHEMGYTMERREIAPITHTPVSCGAPTEALTLRWKRSPEEFFDHHVLNSFAIEENAPTTAGSTTFQLTDNVSNVFVYELDEEMVGHPYVSVQAPAGTVVEIMFAECRSNILVFHDDSRAAGYVSGYVMGSWERFTTREGITHFEAFDFESFRVLCVAVRGRAGDRVEILDAGVVRRLYPFAKTPDFECSDPVINRVHGGGVNTCRNICQETMVDNMVRERQQYSGDVGNTKLSLYLGFGDYALPKRMIRTFARGQSQEGWFFDCFPAWDRLERLWQKAIRTTTSPSTGMIIDHGIGFIHDIHNYVLHSGDTALLEEVYDRTKAHGVWLESIEDADGLIPVEGLDGHSTWIDHSGYLQQRHKTAAMNIYYYGYLAVASAALAELMGDDAYRQRCVTKAAALRERLLEGWWDDDAELFVDNLRWLDEEKGPRYHDRTLSMALLFGLVPEGKRERMVRMMIDCPDCMGLSHPGNAGWRLWALCRNGHGPEVIEDLRSRWGNLTQLLENNTLPESWRPGGAWCQCPAPPVFTLYGDILGIRPLEPGFCKALVYPQLGDLASMSGSVGTPHGDIGVNASQADGSYSLDVTIPRGITATVVLPDGYPSRDVRCAGVDTPPEPASYQGRNAVEIQADAPTQLTVRAQRREQGNG